MASGKIALLSDRGVVSISGADARKLLQGLITNDMGKLTQPGDAIHAALLAPQGKILFDFFVVETPAGFLIETNAEKAADLVKRLALYRLRADATIANENNNYQVYAFWGTADRPQISLPDAVVFSDPRDPHLGYRVIVARAGAENRPTVAAAADTATPEDYAASRIALGVPESDADYDLGNAYPHEADFDLFNGVSFEKGCFVGQEVVARMQNKTVVRKRVVKISSLGQLTHNTEITMGDVAIGKVGTVHENNALALVRLDRAVEAMGKGVPLMAGETTITIDDDALARYRTAAARVTAPGPT